MKRYALLTFVLASALALVLFTAAAADLPNGSVPEIAFDSFGRSMRLNPLDPILRPRITFGYAVACFLAGKYGEGVHWCEKLVAEPPFNLYAMIMFVANASRAGRGDEARKMAEKIRMNYPKLRAADLRLIFRVRKPDHEELIEAIIREIGLS